ncbi:MAG: prolipoprotein diacylglyceryl transferase [Desulfovibrio sp.]|nr:prolipoprotein diacylglyceryl transferase [Desulfovibrio sp.]
MRRKKRDIHSKRIRQVTHTLSPIAFSVAGFDVRWYGLMYLAGFLLGWILGRYRAKRLYSNWNTTDVDDLLTFAMLGVIVGGRIGYILFYDLAVYIQDPSEILRIWNGGMSFHGGLLGVLCAFFYFSRSRHRPFLEVADFVAPLVPQAIFFGRIGNFINGELWGKTSDLPWAIIFPQGGPYPRHPSQLYEAFLEGILLFIILLLFARKRRPNGQISGLFAVGYAVFRFLVEFIRVPDQQLGYLAFGWLTMGQLLCLPLFGIGLWLLLKKQPGTF